MATRLGHLAVLALFASIRGSLGTRAGANVAIPEQQSDKDPVFHFDHCFVAQLVGFQPDIAAQLYSRVLPGPAVQLFVCARPDTRNATRAMARHPRPRLDPLSLSPRTLASSLPCLRTPHVHSNAKLQLFEQPPPTSQKPHAGSSRASRPSPRVSHRTPLLRSAVWRHEGQPGSRRATSLVRKSARCLGQSRADSLSPSGHEQLSTSARPRLMLKAAAVDPSARFSSPDTLQEGPFSRDSQ